jgi:hypothetical protein
MTGVGGDVGGEEDGIGDVHAAMLKMVYCRRCEEFRNKGILAGAAV